MGSPAVSGRATGETPTVVSNAADFKAALEAGGAVELGASFAISERMDIQITKPVTLDLKGHTVTKTYGASNHYFLVINGGSLTLNDSAGNGALIAAPTNDTQYTKYGYGIQLRSNSTFIMNGGTIETSEVSVDIYTVVSNVKVEINAGTIHSTGDTALTARGDANVQVDIKGGTLKTTSNSPTIYVSGGKADALKINITAGELIANGEMTTAAIVGYNYGDVTFGDTAKITATEAQGVTMRGNTSITVTGGTITVNNSHNGRSAAVVVDEDATGAIQGGQITSQNGAALQAEENGSVTISGGTLTSSNNKAAVIAQDASSVHITGGTLLGTSAGGALSKADDTATITVTGGKFSSDVSDYIPSTADITTNPDGSFTVTQETFTITYKTNAGMEMGTVTYVVGDAGNAFPATSEFSKHFGAFLTRAQQKGNVYVSTQPWYQDAAFTQPATFPSGQADQNYTIYCHLTVGNISAGTVDNSAGDLAYNDPYFHMYAHLGLTGQYIAGRNDSYEAGIAVFEKKVGDTWVEVPASYRTDNSGNVWPNIIWFQDVSDSGVYRLKYFRYTATDNSGNVLYYVDAYDGTQGEYTVNITPAPLTITGVQATSRDCDGAASVALTGGELQGVLYGDDVSFALGNGTMADIYAGTGKAVTTSIQLTGAKAGNYTLTQPTDVTVTITCAAAKVEAKAPTCTQDGNKAHWYCANCDKYYTDAALTQETTQEAVTLPALDHTFSTAWSSDETSHWHACTCGEKADLAAHISDGGKVTTQATTTAEGVKTYACTICERVLKTETIPVIKPDPEIPQTGDNSHLWLYIALLGASGLALAILLLLKRKYAR